MRRASGCFMTTLQILLMICFYLVYLGAVVYISRASMSRVMGALAGGAAAGLLALGAIVLGESLGWWQIPAGTVPYFRLQLFVGLAISMAPNFLITWRIARRFRWRGLAVFLGIVTVIGPPRDYLIAATFPEWMTFAPGIAPVLADAATYFGMVALGHAAMRLVAGPADADALRRRSLRTAI
jgi:hypothetical protein